MHGGLVIQLDRHVVLGDGLGLRIAPLALDRHLGPAELDDAAAGTMLGGIGDVGGGLRGRRRGSIIKLSGTEMTVERQRRDPKTKAVTKDDVTVQLNDKTAVHYLGSKDKHGIDVLKLGQDVGVRYLDSNGQKVARGGVILPDHRAGRILSKDADGKSFTIRAANGQTVHITTSDKTKLVEGLGKNKKGGSYTDLKVGDRVRVLGQEDSQHNFDAAVVRTAKPNSATTTPAA